MDLLDFSRETEVAERASEAEAGVETAAETGGLGDRIATMLSFERQLGSTWLLVFGMTLISLAFFALGLTQHESLPVEFHATLFVAGAVVLLVGGIWSHIHPDLEFYSVGLIFAGINLLYSGVWGLYLIYGLITLPQAGLLLLLVHAGHHGLALGYRSPWLQFSAALLGPAVLLLAALTVGYGGALPLLAGLALGLGLALVSDRQPVSPRRDATGVALWYDRPAAGLAAPVGALLAALAADTGLLFPDAGVALWAVAVAATVGGSYGYYRWRDADLTRLPWVPPWLRVYPGPWLLLSAALVGFAATRLPLVQGGAVAFFWLWLQLAVYFRVRRPDELALPVAAAGLALAAVVEPRLAWGAPLALAAAVAQLLVRRYEALPRRALMVSYPVLLVVVSDQAGSGELAYALALVYLVYTALFAARGETELALLTSLPLALVGARADWLLLAPLSVGLALAHFYPHFLPFDRLVGPRNEFSTWLRHRQYLNGWNLALFPVALLASAEAFRGHLWPPLLLVAFAAHHLWRPRLPGRLSLPAALAVVGLGGLVGRPEGVLVATVAVSVALVLRHQRQGEAPLLVGILLVAVAGFPLADDGELHYGWLATTLLLGVYFAFQARFGATPATSLGVQLALVLTLVGALAWNLSAALVVTLAWANAALQVWLPPRVGRLGLAARPSAVALLGTLIVVLGYDGWLAWKQLWLAAGTFLPLLVWRRDDEYGGWTLAAIFWALVPFVVTVADHEPQLLLPIAVTAATAGVLWRGRELAPGPLLMAALVLAIARLSYELVDVDYRVPYLLDTAGVLLLGAYAVGVLARIHPYRWAEALALLLALVTAGSGGAGVLVVAAPLGLLALAWLERDLVTAPLAYMVALAVVAVGVADRTTIEMPYLLAVGLALMVPLALVNLQWGSGDPFSFGWASAGAISLLALPYLVSELALDRALLTGTVAWIVVATVLVEGGFYYRRRYLRLYGLCYLGLILGKILYDGVRLGMEYFVMVLLLYAVVLLLASLSYFLGRGRAEIRDGAGRP